MPKKTPSISLTDLEKRFRISPLGERVWTWLKENEIHIEYDFTLPKSVGGYVSTPYNRISLNPNSTILSLVETLAHESRHLWQAREIAKIENADEPQLSAGFFMNPFSALILKRFTEADAFSFADHFMDQHNQRDLDGLREDMKQRNFSDKQINSVIQGVLDRPRIMKLAKITQTDQRRQGFDNFFTQHSVMDIYDHDSCDGKFYDFFDKLIIGALRIFSKPAKFHGRDFKEEHITAIGKSAWGELDGQNYLADKNGRFDLSRKYTTIFNDKARRRIKRFRWSPGHSGMNRYIDKNGSR